MRHFLKVCRSCGEAKPASAEFFYTRGMRLRSECKACKHEQRAQWRESHREQDRETWNRYNEDVVPLALGGSNGPENIVVTCPHCNTSKQAKHPMDFAGVMF